jgi:hypothetical protein
VGAVAVVEGVEEVEELGEVAVDDEDEEVDTCMGGRVLRPKYRWIRACRSASPLSPYSLSALIMSFSVCKSYL